jgi:hypothetical protein
VKVKARPYIAEARSNTIVIIVIYTIINIISSSSNSSSRQKKYRSYSDTWFCYIYQHALIATQRSQPSVAQSTPSIHPVFLLFTCSSYIFIASNNTNINRSLCFRPGNNVAPIRSLHIHSMRRLGILPKGPTGRPIVLSMSRVASARSSLAESAGCRRCIAVVVTTIRCA